MNKQPSQNRPLIILDRDGVINRDSDEYIKSPAEWIPIPGSLAAIARLNEMGFAIAVATNQSGVGRGYYDLETLERIHGKMRGLLAEEGGRIDALSYCPHHPDDGCACRKPAPGMLEGFLERFDADPAETVMVGDTPGDYHAAMAAGIHFVLVKSGKGMRAMTHTQLPAGVPVFNDLAAYVDSLCVYQGDPPGDPEKYRSGK